MWNATLDADNEPLDVPDDAFDFLADHVDAVRFYIQEDDRRIAKFAAVWWHWDNGYRDYCREYRARQDR